jgi:mono/diheme cytochrome c family protein
MKGYFALCFLFLLVSCVGTNPPVVTPAMARASSSPTVAMAQLQQGRTLFGSRCIECHTLPPITAHTASEWPHLINEMAARANLKPNEREAVLAYVLAARSQ